MIIIETERLTLRQATIKDAPFILKLLNDPFWIKFIGDRGVRTVADAEKYLLDRILGDYEKLGFGMYIVVSKKDQIPIGNCGLIKRDFLDEVDIGFAFLADYTGQGYGFEAANAIMDYAKNHLHIKKIAAIVDEDNTRSIHLLNKLGLHYEKTIAYDGGSDMVALYVSE